VKTGNSDEQQKPLAACYFAFFLKVVQANVHSSTLDPIYLEQLHILEAKVHPGLFQEINLPRLYRLANTYIYTVLYDSIARNF
jgi:hypothetical protein